MTYRRFSGDLWSGQEGCVWGKVPVELELQLGSRSPGYFLSNEGSDRVPYGGPHLLDDLEGAIKTLKALNQLPWAQTQVSCTQHRETPSGPSLSSLVVVLPFCNHCDTFPISLKPQQPSKPLVDPHALRSGGLHQLRDRRDEWPTPRPMYLVVSHPWPPAEVLWSSVRLGMTFGDRGRSVEARNRAATPPRTRSWADDDRRKKGLPWPSDPQPD